MGGNKPYYGKEKNTVLAEKKVSVNTNDHMGKAKVPMGNRPSYDNYKEARPYQGKFYGNKAYYGSPSQEYLNRHHPKVLMGNRKYDDSALYGTKLHSKPKNIQ